MFANIGKTIVSLTARRGHSKMSGLSFRAQGIPFQRCCSFWLLSLRLYFVWFCFSLEENISYRYKFKTFGVTFLVFTECWVEEQPPDTPCHCTSSGLVFFTRR